MIHTAGDQSLLKHINRMALVRIIKAEPGLSRVDLAARAGLTKTTVGMLVSELIGEGWLCEGQPACGLGLGRRPVPVALDPYRIGLLGAELGVDYLNAVACNLQGEVVASRMVPYHHTDVARSIRSLCSLIAKVRMTAAAQGRRVLGVGVGVPGTITAKEQLLRFAPNIGWHDAPLRTLMQKRLVEVNCPDLRVFLLNEANAAALSESVFGVQQYTGPLIYLSMGIGLGAGIVLADQIYTGHEGLAGEVGHTVLLPNGPRCACGRRGCAETLISLQAISREATGKRKHLLAAKEIIQRLANHDRVTVHAVTHAGQHLGLLLQNLCNIINPASVVLGGPLCQLGNVFINAALRGMRDNAGKYDSQEVSVRQSRHGVNACAIGAAASIFQQTLQSSGE